MGTAYAVTNELGLTTSFCTTVGTGGHGDTSKIYHKTYREIISKIKIPIRRSTGIKDKDGKMIYETKYRLEDRVKNLSSIEEINPTVYKEFLKVSHLDIRAKVKCFDLIDTIKDEKGVRDYKVGISIFLGKYKAVIIRKKVQFYINSEPVRTFTGK